MKVILLTGICVAVFAALCRHERSIRGGLSHWLWLPGIWFGLLASRPLSLWAYTLGLAAPNTRTSIEGNPMDANFLLVLILMGIFVLWRRGFSWAAFAGSNKALVLIYCYLALTFAWADYGFPVLKRVFKDFGSVVMALLILTSPHPVQSMRALFVRTAYLLFPLSLVYIKYLPQLGRIPNRSGSSLFVGVTTHKNTLGLMVMVMLLFILLDCVALWREKQQGRPVPRGSLLIRGILIVQGGYLLFLCQSVTSMLCSMLGAVLFWATGRLLKLARPALMVTGAFAFVALAGLLESFFGMSRFIVGLFGRDLTMTGRTEIWHMVLESGTPSLLGCGFFSYWETEYARPIVDLFLGTLKTVHNGYIEMYVDGGIIGVVLLGLLLLTWFRNAITAMLTGSLLGRLTIVFLMLALIYNFSETNFFRPESLWFTLLLLMMKGPVSLTQLEIYAEGGPAAAPVPSMEAREVVAGHHPSIL